MMAADRFDQRELVREILIEREMLTPATSATLLVVKPAQPWSPRTRVPACTIASTVALERAWRGSLRIARRGFGMRVDTGAGSLQKI
jgi:hypothetical protein